jgi:L-malate glycosyltransferase
MKILIFTHKLEVGGTQVNAIELAAALRDFYGYDVVLFATPGPMVKLVEKKGLRFLPAPEPSRHPSPSRARALRNAVRSERPDLLHVWDWWQCLDAYYSVHLPMRVPMAVTDMLMDLTRVLPKRLPTTFGTPELVDQARAKGRKRVELILPPVDVHLNAPGAVDPEPLRKQYSIGNDEITLVTVSRLSPWLKRESLLRTIDVVRTLGRCLPLRFLIVGNGTVRAELEQRANEVNEELDRPAVVLTGALLDPRPAYSAADIVVGMGSSALRGMAFGKPVIIVGEEGFSALFTPETAGSFYYKGIFGRGDGTPGNARLESDIHMLALHPHMRSTLGQFSREFVVQHFSLEMVSEQLANFYRGAAADMPSLHVSAADALRTTAVYLRERKFMWRWVPTPDLDVKTLCPEPSPVPR